MWQILVTFSYSSVKIGLKWIKSIRLYFRWKLGDWQWLERKAVEAGKRLAVGAATFHAGTFFRQLKDKWRKVLQLSGGKRQYARWKEVSILSRRQQLFMGQFWRQSIAVPAISHQMFLSVLHLSIYPLWVKQGVWNAKGWNHNIPLFSNPIPKKGHSSFVPISSNFCMTGFLERIPRDPEKQSKHQLGFESEGNPPAILGSLRNCFTVCTN